MENPLQAFSGPGAQPSVQTPHQASRQHAAQRKKQLLIIGAIAAGALLVAAAAFWFLVVNRDKKAPAKTSATSEQAGPPAVQTPPDSTPVTYKSAKLNIEITHRKDWTLKESASASEVVLTSPRTTYTKANATAGTNVFTLKIRKGAPETMKATIEKAVAVRDSEVIAYAAPTESQRYYTNISYAGASEAFHFFIVTGSVELKSGNPFAYTLTLTDDTYLIAGGYGTDPSGSLSFDPVPKGSFDTPALQQALDIVKSLKIF